MSAAGGQFTQPVRLYSFSQLLPPLEKTSTIFNETSLKPAVVHPESNNRLFTQSHWLLGIDGWWLFSSLLDSGSPITDLPRQRLPAGLKPMEKYLISPTNTLIVARESHVFDGCWCPW